MPEEPNKDPRIVSVVFEFSEHSQAVPLTENEAIKYLLASLHGGPCQNLRRAFETMQSVKSYRRLIRNAAKVIDSPQEFRDRFHTAWTVEGFRWRDAVNNDALLSRALRAVLPAYVGVSQTLFRGELAARYDAGRLGFNWTPRRDVAEMFASGLCSLYDGGGILLTANAPPTAIISSPGPHSKYLSEDEFVVESSLLTNVLELVRYPKTWSSNA